MINSNAILDALVSSFKNSSSIADAGKYGGTAVALAKRDGLPKTYAGFRFEGDTAGMLVEDSKPYETRQRASVLLFVKTSGGISDKDPSYAALLGYRDSVISWLDTLDAQTISTSVLEITYQGSSMVEDTNEGFYAMKCMFTLRLQLK